MSISDEQIQEAALEHARKVARPEDSEFKVIEFTFRGLEGLRAFGEWYASQQTAALQHIADHCTVTDLQCDDEWMGNDGDDDLAHLLEWIESNRRAVEPAIRSAQQEGE